MCFSPTHTELTRVISNYPFSLSIIVYLNFTRTQIDCLSLSAKIPILNPNPEIPPPMDRVTWRTQVLSNHLNQPSMSSPLSPNPCIGFSPPELSEPFEFDTKEMRKLLDAHNLEDRDWLFGLMKQSKLFNPREAGGRVFVSPDYNQSMEQQREMTMKRIAYLLDRGVFEGWLTEKGVEAELRKLALHEVIGIYDHSLAVKLGVHFFLWYGNLVYITFVFACFILFFIAQHDSFRLVLVFFRFLSMVA